MAGCMRDIQPWYTSCKFIWPAAAATGTCCYSAKRPPSDKTSLMLKSSTYCQAWMKALPDQKRHLNFLELLSVTVTSGKLLHMRFRLHHWKSPIE